MSSHRIRHNKTCQNCGKYVERRFCPACGQENTESRQSFYHLFTHFASDLLHYKSSFWRTVRYLLFSPGKLSIEYMNGRRKSYANPFSLYIFISFLAFFIPAVIPNFSSNQSSESNDINITVNEDLFEEITTDTLNNIEFTINTDYGRIRTAKELEAKHQSLPEEKRLSTKEYYFYEIIINITNNINKERGEKAIEFFIHNLPKALFLYMPIFAFWMWLFHNKRKRYYFDSGIFTLHFFSFWLLLLTVLLILTSVLGYFDLEILSSLLIFTSIIYTTFYFFRANRKFYGEGRFISNLKALILMFINTFFILIVTLLYTVWTIFVIFL